MHEAELVNPEFNRNSRNYVIKFIDVTKSNYNDASFEQESNIMREIASHNLQGFSKLIDIGQAQADLTHGLYSSKYRFMIMEKLGVSVCDIFDMNENYLAQVDVMKLGISLIKNIKELHKLGYVHLDIKPDNMLLDTPSEEVKSTNNINSERCFWSDEISSRNVRRLQFN